MSNQHLQQYQHNERDLKEIFSIIAKYKFSIIIITILITAIAAAIAFSQTPIYRARALIEIGNYKPYNNSINNEGGTNSHKVIIEDPKQLSKKLRVLFIDLEKHEGEKVKIETIQPPKDSKNFIEITATSISNDLAVQEIQKIVNYIKTQHQKILEDIKQRREIEIQSISAKMDNILRKEIPLLNNKIALKKRLLADYQKQIKIISKSINTIETIDSSLAVFKLMERRDLTTLVINLSQQLTSMQDKKFTLKNTTINDLQKEKFLISSLMLPHNYQNSHIVGQIITSEYPIKPKKKLIVAVAFIIGLILSIFLAFFRDFMATPKDDTIK